MQIQSGWARGIKLKSPSGLTTRPTSAKIRAAVFDMLRFRVELHSVLDLFSGSGAVGLESISQGAQKAVFVDQSAEAVKTLKSNLNTLQVSGRKQGIEFQSEVIPQDVVKYISTHGSQGGYDLIWADPPYKLVVEVLDKLIEFSSNSLSGDGVFILESSSKDQSKVVDMSSRFEKISIFKQKCYGETLISMYTRKSEQK